MAKGDIVELDADELNAFVAQVAANLILVQSDLRLVINDLAALGAAVETSVLALEQFIKTVNKTMEEE